MHYHNLILNFPMQCRKVNLMFQNMFQNPCPSTFQTGLRQQEKFLFSNKFHERRDEGYYEQLF